MKRGLFLLLALLLVAGCTNNPYPSSDSGRRILYEPFYNPPKTLDPAVAYSVVDHRILANIYETLLEYHYLKRPYTLIPGLATAVPRAEELSGGRIAYRFRLRDDIEYQSDPCFELDGPGRRTRHVRAADVAFELMRLADPKVNSPVIANFARIEGFRAFSKRLAKRRAQDPAFARERIDRQYADVGGIQGVRVLGPLELEVVLSEPYPQILYWFAMPFTAPMPWEAVATYTGNDGHPALAEHPVGTGPFRLTVYQKRSRIVLERNDAWYGIRHPEWHAPAATYPRHGAPGDAAAGLLDPKYVGRPLPFLDGIEFHLEKESIPAFTKFLQGYYDESGITPESFDRVVHEGALSPDMVARGMHLVKTVEPAIYYIGFNMLDPVVGSPAGAHGRKLRQAMSLAIDVREYERRFMNGRGIPAQSPIPPGIFGYEKNYRNPYRQPNLARARKLLAEAGYPGGIDPKTGKPLQLSFDTPDTQARARLRFQFFVDAWSRLGLDVEIDATNYNRFQQKVHEGAYQIFTWGWVADYPDPENFLFLLWSPMGQTKSGGPNTANFSDPQYDRLFLAMRTRKNDARRLEIIRKMRKILERQRPWIELYYPEDYALYHGWLHNLKPAGLSVPTAKYLDVEPAERARFRAKWNRPVLWPAYVLAGLGVALLAPAVATYLRERR